MKNITIFLSENFHFLVVKFLVYLDRRVFVMVVRILPKTTDGVNFIAAFVPLTCPVSVHF